MKTTKLLKIYFSTKYVLLFLLLWINLVSFGIEPTRFQELFLLLHDATKPE